MNSAGKFPETPMSETYWFTISKDELEKPTKDDHWRGNQDEKQAKSFFNSLVAYRRWIISIGHVKSFERKKVFRHLPRLFESLIWWNKEV